MQTISEHISWDEACSAASAKKHGIINIPNPGHITRMKIVANNIFEPARYYAGVPLYVPSFYRCPELNKAVGGSRNSQHILGEAIDFKNNGKGITNGQLFYHIAGTFFFDQLIWEFGDYDNPGWLHASFKITGNRNKITMAYKQNGNDVYDHFKSIYEFDNFKSYLYGK